MFKKLLLFRPTNDERRGQALVEFSLTVLVFIVLLLMIIELARIMYTYVNLQHSARLAARYAVTGQWMTEYSSDPKAHFVISPPYTAQDRIPPCWPLFNDDTVAPVTITTDPPEQSFQPYRDARTCSIERVALDNMVGLALDPSAGVTESGYYRVLVSGVGKSVDPSATWNRMEYQSPGGWSQSPDYTYQRHVGDPTGGLDIYQHPTSGFQLIAGYGGLPQQKVVVQIEYRLHIIAPILSSIAPNVRLTATAIMTNEAFGSTGLNREAVLPPELPELPDFIVPSPTNLKVTAIQGLPGTLEDLQYGKPYNLEVVVSNEGDTAILPDQPIVVEVYFAVGDTPPDVPQIPDLGSSPWDPSHRAGTGSEQVAVSKGTPVDFAVPNAIVPEQSPGDKIWIYACVDTTNKVDETDGEDDNCYRHPDPFNGDIYADLTITDVDFVSGKDPAQGETMQIMVKVKNNGPSASHNADLKITWNPSSSNLFIGYPTSIDVVDMPEIGPGDTYALPAITPQVSWSAGGSYNLTFTLLEGDEKDPQLPADTWVDSIAVNGVDLRITQEFRIDGVEVPSDQIPVLNPNETLTVRFIVENLSGNPAQNVRVYHTLPPTNPDGAPPDPDLIISPNPPNRDPTGTWDVEWDPVGHPDESEWLIGTLNPTLVPGDEAVLDYTVQLAAGAPGNIDWVSAARVETSSPTFNPGDDSVSTDARVASADISVTMSTSLGANPRPREEEQFTITVTVTNSGPDTATGVKVEVPIDDDLDYVSVTEQIGNYTQSDGVWDIGDLETGSYTLAIVVDPVTGSGVNPPFAIIAELTAADQYDIDSTPDNGVVSEDDYASMIVDVGGRVDLAVESFDFTVNGDSGVTTAYNTDLVTYTITVSNDDDYATARDVEVTLDANVPIGIGFGGFTVNASQGTFDPATGVWDVEDMPEGTTETLVLSARLGVGSRTDPSTFDVTATIDSADIDPIPYNNTLSAPTLHIRPLFVNLGRGGSSNCNQERVWDNVNWLPTEEYGSGEHPWWGHLADSTSPGTWGDIIDPSDANGQRIMACRVQDSDEVFDVRVDNLPQGDYFLTLYFVEQQRSASDERVFDVSVNGTPWLSGLDIFYEVGQNIMLTKTTSFNIASDLGSLIINLADAAGGPVRTPVLSGFGIEFDVSTIPTPTPTTPPPDTTPPTNPSSLSSSSHTVGVPSSDTTITVSWSNDATDDISGVAGYSVAWSNSATTTPDTTIDYVEDVYGENSPELADGDWYYHLRTCDNVGNCAGAMHAGPFTISTAVPTNAFGPGYYEQTHEDFNYTGTWGTWAGGSGGTTDWTIQAGASVAFVINGDGFTIYRPTSGSWGPMQVCIDGSCQTISNTGPPTGASTPVDFSVSPGVHNIVVTNLNAQWIGFDALEVRDSTIPTPTPPPPGVLYPGYYEQSHPDINYSGTWGTWGGGSGGTTDWTQQVGASADFVINGDQLTIYRPTSGSWGPMQVCIDGSCQTISNTGPPIGPSTPVTFSGLGAGDHTVVITNLNTQWIGLDAIEVQ